MPELLIKHKPSYVEKFMTPAEIEREREARAEYRRMRREEREQLRKGLRLNVEPPEGWLRDYALRTYHSDPGDASPVSDWEIKMARMAWRHMHLTPEVRKLRAMRKSIERDRERRVRELQRPAPGYPVLTVPIDRPFGSRSERAMKPRQPRLLLRG
jgi:hypothetical protein